MAANDYHFITTWRLVATVEEISEILGNGTDLARWWPSVYLEVDQVELGGPDGVGAVVGLYTKGWLPYTLRWSFRVTENRNPHGFSLEAIGDFVGRGIWTFEQVGDETVATYDWKTSAQKGVLKHLSLVMKPIFAANHRWAMARGEESLRLELARRKKPPRSMRGCASRPRPRSRITGAADATADPTLRNTHPWSGYNRREWTRVGQAASDPMASGPG